MKQSFQLLRLCGSAAVMLVAGCAPAYHSYSGCNVNCKYCPPPPLQYRHYEDCACHSCAAIPYLTTAVMPVPQEVAEGEHATE